MDVPEASPDHSEAAAGISGIAPGCLGKRPGMRLRRLGESAGTTLGLEVAPAVPRERSGTDFSCSEEGPGSDPGSIFWHTRPTLQTTTKTISRSMQLASNDLERCAYNVSPWLVSSYYYYHSHHYHHYYY